MSKTPKEPKPSFFGNVLKGIRVPFTRPKQPQQPRSKRLPKHT